MVNPNSLSGLSSKKLYRQASHDSYSHSQCGLQNFTQSILSQDSLEQILFNSYKLLVCITQFFNSWADRPISQSEGGSCLDR